MQNINVQYLMTEEHLPVELKWMPTLLAVVLLVYHSLTVIARGALAIAHCSRLS
jgi:hypothetical protein